MNTAQNAADQLGMLLAQIAELTKQADAIKDQMKDAASAGGPTVFEGSLFKCTYTACDRKSIDYTAILADNGLSHLAKNPDYIKTTAVFSIKTTSR